MKLARELIGNWESVGNHDLRMDAQCIGGFWHVVLRDADDGDLIMINEDDLVALRDKLNQIIQKAGL